MSEEMCEVFLDLFDWIKAVDSSAYLAVSEHDKKTIVASNFGVVFEMQSPCEFYMRIDDKLFKFRCQKSHINTNVNEYLNIFTCHYPDAVIMNARKIKRTDKLFRSLSASIVEQNGYVTAIEAKNGKIEGVTH